MNGAASCLKGAKARRKLLPAGTLWQISRQKNLKGEVLKLTCPNHYKQGSRETIEVIKDILSDKAFTAYEGFLTGNIIKYVTRCIHKDGVNDLDKAAMYLGWMKQELINRKAEQ